MMLPQLLDSDIFVKLLLDIIYLQLLFLLPGVSGKRTNSVTTNALTNGILILYLNNIKCNEGEVLEYSECRAGYQCLKKEKIQEVLKCI